MAENQMLLPHRLTLNERKHLSVTGVSEVVSFEETGVVLRTQLGLLVIRGEGLQLKTLSLEGGQVVVEGTVEALQYEAQRQTGSWLRNLLG